MEDKRQYNQYCHLSTAHPKLITLKEVCLAGVFVTRKPDWTSIWSGLSGSLQTIHPRRWSPLVNFQFKFHAIYTIPRALCFLCLFPYKYSNDMSVAFLETDSYLQQKRERFWAEWNVSLQIVNTRLDACMK